MSIRVFVFPRVRPPSTVALGFSLVELMVAMVLGIFLIGAVIVTFIAGKAASNDAEDLSRMQENVRIVSEHLIRDLRATGFADELSLTFGDLTFLNEEFGLLQDQGERLSVRYSGRGHCGERFDRFVVVENEYSVEDGELICKGRHRAGGDWEEGGSVSIISGVSAILFEPIPKDCDFSRSSENTCVGVSVKIDFDGVGGGSDEERRLELKAAFRNVILEQISSGGSGDS